MDTKLNANVRSLIERVEISAVLSKRNFDEYSGNWDELMQSREDDLETFQCLFSMSAGDLTMENQLDIARLKADAYPRIVCQLGKCYLAKGRYSEAKAVLQKAIDN